MFRPSTPLRSFTPIPTCSPHRSINNNNKIIIIIAVAVAVAVAVAAAAAAGGGGGAGGGVVVVVVLVEVSPNPNGDTEYWCYALGGRQHCMVTGSVTGSVAAPVLALISCWRTLLYHYKGPGTWKVHLHTCASAYLLSWSLASLIHEKIVATSFQSSFDTFAPRTCANVESKL